jgi:anti-anti-sigma factor
MSEGEAIRVGTERPATGVVVVWARGEIGYSEAPVFRQALRAAQDSRPQRVVVDLAEVDYMSTPGVATLVEALQGSKKAKSRLVLCGMNERVRAIFDIARLTAVFEIAPDRAAALT